MYHYKYTYIYIFIINYLCFIVLPAIMGATQRLAHTQPWYPHVYKGRSLPGQNFLLVFTDSGSQLSNCRFWEKIFYNQNYNLFQSKAYWEKFKVIPKVSQGHTKLIPNSSKSHSKFMQNSSQSHPKDIPKSSQIHPKDISKSSQSHQKSLQSHPKVIPKSSQCHSKVMAK